MQPVLLVVHFPSRMMRAAPAVSTSLLAVKQNSGEGHILSSS